MNNNTILLFSNLKRLVKICHRKSSYTHVHACISFLHKIVFYLGQLIYCSKRYAYSIIEQHEKCAFHRTQGNQVFVDEEIKPSLPKTCLFLHLFHFLLQVAHFCNLFIMQIRCRYPWIAFFRKRSLPEICEEKMEYLGKQQTRSTCNFKHYTKLPQVVRIRIRNKLSAKFN